METGSGKASVMATSLRESKRQPTPALENGDQLDQKAFHARYEASPSSVRAELVGGTVFMSAPLKPEHGRYGSRVVHWLVEYELATPGTEVLENTSHILGPLSEPQPDACLIILPAYGGRTWEDKNGHLHGGPEFIAEISTSTESLDLHQKKRDYEKAGVREYLVVALRSRQVFWFISRRGKFRELAADSGGIFRSETFPGLWLDSAALLRRDAKRMLAVLHRGLATPEHAHFVSQLARQRR